MTDDWEYEDERDSVKEEELDQEEEESDVEEGDGVDNVEDVEKVEDMLKLGKGENLRRMRWGLDVAPTKGATGSSEEEKDLSIPMSSRS